MNSRIVLSRWRAMALDVGAETGHVLAVVLVRIIMLIPEKKKQSKKCILAPAERKVQTQTGYLHITEPKTLKNYIRMKAAFCKIL